MPNLDACDLREKFMRDKRIADNDIGIQAVTINSECFDPISIHMWPAPILTIAANRYFTAS